MARKLRGFFLYRCDIDPNFGQFLKCIFETPTELFFSEVLQHQNHNVIDVGGGKRCNSGKNRCGKPTHNDAPLILFNFWLAAVISVESYQTETASN
ncbi:hypothetical protein [Microcoleus anatoxicus]|uniref:hypothetical protein n=1 Tax=Microcoleus anatoxicus TaxID=2705319 RepID=UPI0030CA0DB8